MSCCGTAYHVQAGPNQSLWIGFVKAKPRNSAGVSNLTHWLPDSVLWHRTGFGTDRHNNAFGSFWVRFSCRSIGLEVRRGSLPAVIIRFFVCADVHGWGIGGRGCDVHSAPVNARHFYCPLDPFYPRLHQETCQRINNGCFVFKWLGMTGVAGMDAGAF